MMELRRAVAGDVDRVTELTARAYAPWTEAFGTPPIPVTEDYAPRIAGDEVWLLEESGAAVGLIVLEDDIESLLIFSVAVLPERQGEGLGRRLLAFAEDEALKRGCASVSLYTNARMTQNIALYRRLGYEETGRRDNPLRPGFIRVDMEKRLTSGEAKRRIA